MALFRPAQGTPRGAFLHVHPFAEEMNKSRRMAALAAQALSQAGFAVLQLDLHGCGDSSGELEDASWDGWLDDVALGADWLQQGHGGPLWLWGERAGCLLAAEAASRLQGEVNFLFWQAQASGRQALQQFLRLKMASQMQNGSSKGVTEALQKELAGGRAVEVAGYRLGPGVARGLEAASLQRPPAVKGSHCVWLEVTSREPAALLPASQAVLEQWRTAGHNVVQQAVSGPPFWQTLEIEDAPALIQATLQCIQRCENQVPA